AGEDSTVRLWEVATGLERRRLEGHRGRVLSVAFSRDGCTLLSGGDDTAVLVWDLAGTAEKAAPTRAELERRWEELGGADAARAAGGGTGRGAGGFGPRTAGTGRAAATGPAACPLTGRAPRGSVGERAFCQTFRPTWQNGLAPQAEDWQGAGASADHSATCHQ